MHDETIHSEIYIGLSIQIVQYIYGRVYTR